MATFSHSSALLCLSVCLPGLRVTPPEHINNIHDSTSSIQHVTVVLLCPPELLVALVKISSLLFTAFWLIFSKGLNNSGKTYFFPSYNSFPSYSSFTHTHTLVHRDWFINRLNRLIYRLWNLISASRFHFQALWAYNLQKQKKHEDAFFDFLKWVDTICTFASDIEPYDYIKIYIITWFFCVLLWSVTEWSVLKSTVLFYLFIYFKICMELWKYFYLHFGPCCQSNCGRCGLKSDLHAYELLVVTKIMTLEV